MRQQPECARMHICSDRPALPPAARPAVPRAASGELAPVTLTCTSREAIAEAQAPVLTLSKRSMIKIRQQSQRDKMQFDVNATATLRTDVTTKVMAVLQLVLPCLSDGEEAARRGKVEANACAQTGLLQHKPLVEGYLSCIPRAVRWADLRHTLSSSSFTRRIARPSRARRTHGFARTTLRRGFELLTR